MRKTIFVVDDNDTNLATAEKGLEDHYNILTLPSGRRMFTVLKKIRPDLILLDIEMPEMDGFQVLGALKESEEYRDIPVIFLTGLQDAAVEARGFELGVVDFISKPFSKSVLINRVKLHIDVSSLIKERTAALEDAHRNMLFVLADIVENRDAATGGHIDRTTEFVRILIEEMLARGIYSEEVSQWDLENVVICAALHDVGKIMVSDLILNKPGRLTEEEFNDMKAHASSGANIISRVIDRTGSSKFLHDARMFAEYHHENWNGKGYPHGLKGDEIPLQGRIMAIADTYDALVSARPYKSAFTDEEAINIIVGESGKRFDPTIVEVFLFAQDKIKEAREKQQEKLRESSSKEVT